MNEYLRLPPRMKAICHSLLKTIEEYDVEMNALQRPQGAYKLLSKIFILFSITHNNNLTLRAGVFPARG